jgi:hypothetical protein
MATMNDELETLERKSVPEDSSVSDDTEFAGMELGAGVLDVLRTCSEGAKLVDRRGPSEDDTMTMYDEGGGDGEVGAEGTASPEEEEETLSLRLEAGGWGVDGAGVGVDWKEVTRDNSREEEKDGRTELSTRDVETGVDDADADDW